MTADPTPDCEVCRRLLEPNEMLQLCEKCGRAFCDECASSKPDACFQCAE